MKSKEFKKIFKYHRCNVCKKVKWVYRDEGWWCDGRCEECADNYEIAGEPEREAEW